MSDTALEARIGVGAVLASGARIALRHWLLGLVAIVAMAGMLLLLLDLAGLCFGTGRPACLSPAFFESLGSQKPAVIGDLLVLAPFLAAYVVSLVMLRLFYLTEPVGLAGYSRVRTVRLRPLRFAGRLALAWSIIVVPLLVLNIGYRHLAWLLYPGFVGVDVLWLGYFLVTGVGLFLGSYLRARILLYVPSVAYQDEPERLPALWHYTGPVRWRLFLIFFPIDVGVTLLQSALYRLTPQVADLGTLAQGLSGWSRVDLQYVSALLVPALAYAVLVSLTGLWNAGIAVVAYRKLVTIDHARASVFD